MSEVRRSQNGWTVHSTSAGLKPLSWITGRVDPAVRPLFDHFCRRFHAEVEPINPAHSWGYAYRAIRGQVSGYSNHASGTAIDLNAPAHPLGKRGTFSGAQAAKIRSILRDYGGVIRWGGDYKNRADEMHFEVNATPARVATVVKRLTATPPTQEDQMTPAQEAKLDRALALLDRLPADTWRYKNADVTTRQAYSHLLDVTRLRGEVAALAGMVEAMGQATGLDPEAARAVLTERVDAWLDRVTLTVKED